MKHFIYIILTIAALGATFASCGSSKNNNEAKPEKKVLVAYFSATGNTRKIANDVAEIMGGKLHEITPAEATRRKTSTGMTPRAAATWRCIPQEAARP